MPTAKVSDINIYYEVHGKGEPLAMITGWTGNTDAFFMHIPVFSREYQVVVFDPRGAGRSDAPDIPYSMEMMADDLAGLLDVIGVESAHIFGISMGGVIAQHFALLYPKRVRSIILASTGCGPAHGAPITDPEFLDVLAHPRVLPPKESAMAALRMCVSEKFIKNNPDLVEGYIEKLAEYPAPPQGMIRQSEATMHFDTYERLPEIKAPTLIIHGEADRMIPVENARILASRIPGAELAILHEMGHVFTFEAFDASNKIILDFLRRNRSSS